VARRPARGDRVSRAQQVASSVEEEILEARLPVGAHLGRRTEFMARFGISSPVMNETLRILRSRGLVSVRPGTGGGIFIASLPPHVRLGAIDLWFTGAGTHPLELFEARVHLEARLTEVAFDRATSQDIAAMRRELELMTHAADARAFLEAVMSLHRALVSAARVPMLDDMHQVVIALLRSSLSKAVYIDGYQEMLQHSLDVHTGIIDAISSRDRTAFEKVMRLHSDDLIRADDPRRSPGTRPV
jgi:DNA-binding FadR family transcriptional regulator